LTIKSESREQIEHPIHVRRKLKCKYANFFSRCYFFFCQGAVDICDVHKFPFCLKTFPQNHNKRWEATQKTIYMGEIIKN